MTLIRIRARIQRPALMGAALLAVMLCATAAHAQPDVPDGGVPQANDGIADVLVVGNRCYVAGAFSTFGGQSRAGLAAFDINPGQVDLAWDPQLGGGTLNPPTPVGVGLASDGTNLYVAGDFTTVNSPPVARNFVAALELANGSNTGQADPAWDPNLSGTFPVYGSQIAVDGSKVYVTGRFDTVNGFIPRNSLAAFNLANGVDIGAADVWDPNLTSTLASPSPPATGPILVSGGVVHVGGNFDAANGGIFTRNSLVALEPANGSNLGAADPNWDPDVTFSLGAGLGFIGELAIEGLRLYASGQFDTVNGSVARDNLAAFDVAGGAATGEVDAAWNPDVGDPLLGDSAGGMTITNSQVFVGGVFTTAGGSPRNNAAAFNLAGSGPAVLQSWDPDVTLGFGPVFGPGIGALKPSGPIGLWMGGRFDAIGGTPLSNFAGFSSTVPVELSLFGVD